jgi:hypothetical protein
MDMDTKQTAEHVAKLFSDDYQKLTAERDTLKALCVDHLAELEYLYGQTRFNLDDRERWRAMAERARSILK